MIITAVALLLKNPSPTREQIVAGMENNFCRCSAHVRIIEAIKDASVQMKGGK
jgi:carbon-monoxide dehydrogenase small subunit